MEIGASHLMSCMIIIIVYLTLCDQFLSKMLRFGSAGHGLVIGWVTVLGSSSSVNSHVTQKMSKEIQNIFSVNEP